MTETGINTTNPLEGLRVAGSVGLALRDVTLRVTSPETGMALSANEIGIIEVRGPNVFDGYWGMPDKTSASFARDGFFKTGDLGRIDEGGYVHIVGRDKDLIITGGYNVYPKEIEIEIDALDGVVESAVIGIPHPDLGEGVTAVVVKRAECNLSEKQIMTHIADRLARFKLPKKIIFEDELPRNAMGKVQKNQLREKNAKIFLR